MAVSGTGPVNFTDDLMYDDSSRMNLEGYKTILPTNIQENATRLIRKCFILHQDNDPKHSASSVKEFIRAKKWKVLDCPSQSPDLNLIEYEFHLLKRKSLKTEHVGHWEVLETWLSVATDSLLPKAAETLKHQTQDQLEDNLTSLMGQDLRQNYSHKEVAKITSSLSHTLIATLKLSNKHAAQRQQELTSAQRRIEQLELEAQERQEGTDEVEQGAQEEINRLKETLAATSHEMEQIKEDYADHADKLQYAEQLLEKAKADFRDKNSRIKALEANLDESRNEISRLTRQLDYFKEEY